MSVLQELKRELGKKTKHQGVLTSSPSHLAFHGLGFHLLYGLVGPTLNRSCYPLASVHITWELRGRDGTLLTDMSHRVHEWFHDAFLITQGCSRGTTCQVLSPLPAAHSHLSSPRT